MTAVRTGANRRQEKNATFSAWLIRRMGASGSDGALDLGTSPFAMMVEPSDGSTATAGAGSGKICGRSGAVAAISGCGCGALSVGFVMTGSTGGGKVV